MSLFFTNYTAADYYVVAIQDGRMTVRASGPVDNFLPIMPSLIRNAQIIRLNYEASTANNVV